MSASSVQPVPHTSSAAAQCELSIVMPCLDEAETVGACVEKAAGYLRQSGIFGEVLVVDNGSADGSPAIARASGARVVHEQRRGYGNALLAGIEAAHGRYVIMADADDSYDFTALAPLVEKLREGYDLVMGNRFEGGIAEDAMPPLHRYLGNPLLTGIGRLFFRSPVRDFHCGLRGFRRDAVLGLGLTTRGMEFASEMVVKATLAGLSITEVPVTLSPAGRTRPPHLRSFRDGWRHLRFLLLFSPRWLFLYPGMALTLLGLASMLWLLPAPRHVMGVGLDVNTLVYSAAATVCGFQAMLFAVFAKVFAIDARLLPEDPKMRWATSPASLEAGLVAGLLLILGGFASGAYAVGLWGGRSFGPLDPQVTLRIVAPSATALILGVQLAFSSFFLGVLGLKRR
ncbi:MAG TPA: glycosyltransferase family 2 protein [Longimicrobiales bacterium]|nr:glycosyltransferase family 2 protein [Longimicrobiales bacterium]